MSEMILSEEIATICEDRSEMYGLLARLLRTEADQPLLDTLSGMCFPAENGNEDLDVGSYTMAKYLSNLWEHSVEDLAIDYSRCFIGQGIDGRGAAYPFESVYTSEKHLRMQEARDEVLAIYRSVGLGKAEDYKENEDSLAAELEFMSILASRTATAICEGNAEEAQSLLLTQAHFLEDHLMRWTNVWCDDVLRLANTGFYQAAARMTRGTLTTDRELLDEWVVSFNNKD